MTPTRKDLRHKKQKYGLINKKKVNTFNSEMSVKNHNFLETKILFMKIYNDYISMMMMILIWPKL